MSNISKLAIKKYFTLCSSASIVNFEHIFGGWVPVIIGKVLKTFGSSGRLNIVTKQFVNLDVPVVTMHVKIVIETSN